MSHFDAASSLPLHPVAQQALLAALDEGWADPARPHREGRRARMLLDAARETAAEAVGCRPDELSFTSSGTRALHTGIAGALAGRRRVGRQLVLSAVEHSAVLHAAAAHERAGGPVREVGVDRTGRVDVKEYGEALGPTSALACLQSANHEVGTVQPVAETAALCAEAGVPLLVDAAQTLPWEAPPEGWSLLTASAHKWGGPGGVGLLAVRKGARFAAPEPTDERESGRAPGFENIPAVVAAAASLRAIRAEAEAEAARLRALVDRIRERVPALVPETEVMGDPVRRLPHLVTFSCLYVDGEAVLHALDAAGFSVSSGSSCTASTLTPSHVLRAMGVLSEGNVRVSLPPGVDEEEVDRFLAVLPGVVDGVRAHVGAATGGASVSDGAPAPGGAVGASGAGEAGGASAAHEDSADSGSPGLTVDALGKKCPVPVIELAQVIEQVPVGGLVTVLADDVAARLDIPAWCEMTGHSFVDRSGDVFRVRRAGAPG